jgi:hypothetical protein
MYTFFLADPVYKSGLNLAVEAKIVVAFTFLIGIILPKSSDIV